MQLIQESLKVLERGLFGKPGLQANRKQRTKRHCLQAELEPIKKAKSILLIGRSYPFSEENEKLGTNPRLGPEGDERPLQSIKKRENRIPAGGCTHLL